MRRVFSLTSSLMNDARSMACVLPRPLFFPLLAAVVAVLVLVLEAEKRREDVGGNVALDTVDDPPPDDGEGWFGMSAKVSLWGKERPWRADCMEAAALDPLLLLLLAPS
jgi:hypothetical protein